MDGGRGQKGTRMRGQRKARTNGAEKEENSKDGTVKSKNPTKEAKQVKH
jgi:hypothetical protein